MAGVVTSLLETWMSVEQWTVELYTENENTESKESIVEKELKEFGTKQFSKVFRIISLLEDYGLELGGDYLEHIQGKLWQLRVDRVRVLYFTFTGRKIVLLRAFMKKTAKTPLREIGIATKRMDKYVIQAAKLNIER